MMPPRTAWAIALVLTLLGAALRLHDLDSASLWKDEIHQASMTQMPVSLFIGRLAEVENDMPLDYIAQHAVMQVAPETDFWVRFHAALFGTLTILAAFLLLSALLGPKAALTAAVLLTFSPFHLHYSQEGRPYALLLLLTVLSTWALWQLMRAERRTWIWGLLYLITAVASVWTHLSATLVIACQQLWACSVAALALSRHEHSTRRPLGRVAISLGVSVLAAVSILPVMQRVTGGAIGDAGIPFAPLSGELVLKYLNGLTFARAEYTQWVPAGLIGGPLILLGLIWGFRCRPAATWLLVCQGLGVIALMFALCWRRDHWFSLRYVFPALVPVLGLMALGVLAVIDGASRLSARTPAERTAAAGVAAAVLLAAFAGAAGTFLWTHPTVKRDWRGAAEWIATHVGLEDTLLISDNDWRRLSYYMDRHQWLGLLSVVDRDDLVEIDPHDHLGEFVFLRSGSEYDPLRERLNGFPTAAELHRLEIVHTVEANP